MIKEDWFNPEIKERFLVYCEQEYPRYMSVAAKNAFRACSCNEKETGCDVSQMSPDLIYHSAFEDGYPFDSESRRRLQVISYYKKWCLDNNVLPSVDCHLLRYSDMPDDIFLRSMERYIYADPAEMLDELAKLYSFTNGHPQVPVCCLLWEGLQAKEINILKDDQVDLEKRKFVGRVENEQWAKKIHPELANAMMLFKQTRVGIRLKVTPMCDYPAQFNVYPVHNGYFITPFRKDVSKTDPLNFGNVLKFLDRDRDSYEEKTGEILRLHPRYVSFSGRMYRMLQMEDEGLDYDSLSYKETMALSKQIPNGGNVVAQYKLYKKFREQKLSHNIRGE